MWFMRTTIDIPPALHQRLMAYAKTRGESFSLATTEALMRGMASVETASSGRINPATRLMSFNFDRGRPVTSDEVANLIEEDS